jgi:hypothetical protein
LAGLAGDARKAIHSLEKLRVATIKAEFNLLLKQERQVLRASIQPRDAWPLYLQVRAQVGNIEAISTLRKLDASAREAQRRTPSITGTLILEDALLSLKSLVHFVERNGDVVYSRNGRAILRDEGKHIAILDEQSEQAIVSGLLIAREKFGSTLTLTGSPEFKQRVVALAVSKGISVKFADPALEEMRLFLVETNRRTMSTHKPQPVVPSNQPAQQEQAQRAAAPAAEIPTEQTVEVVTTPQQLTAAQWIASQQKREVRPHQSGDGSVEYTVAYVAQDGVVVNHGRNVATYPLPPNTVFRAEQKIVIGKSGLIVIPPRRIEVEGGKGRGD